MTPRAARWFAEVLASGGYSLIDRNKATDSDTPNDTDQHTDDAMDRAARRMGVESWRGDEFVALTKMRDHGRVTPRAVPSGRPVMHPALSVAFGFLTGAGLIAFGVAGVWVWRRGR